MKEPIRGLAIAGGGAKGAYSFGCIKALQEVSFDAVAGTSAGALNAAIVASQDMDLGEKLWLGVTPENTLQHWPWMRRLGTWPARLIFLSILIPNLLVNRMRGRPLMPGGDRLANVVLCLMLFANLACAFAIISTLSGNPLQSVPFSTYVVPAACAASFLLVLELSQWTVTKRGILLLNLPVLLAVFCSLWVYVLAAPIDWLFGNRLDDIHGLIKLSLTLFYALILLIASFFSAGSVILLLLSVSRFLARIVAYDASALRKTVEDFLDTAQLQRPAFATLASEVKLFDPDDPFWFHSYGRQSWLMATAEGNTLSDAQRQGPWEPSNQSVWLQCYARFDVVNSSRAADFLTASAALPFGVCKSVTINNTSYVDGGVAHNFPLLPLADYGCEEIFLLCLDAVEHDPTTGLTIWTSARAAHLKRRALLATRPLPHPVPGDPPPCLRNDPPQIVPIPEIMDWPHIVVFRPRRRLGGLFGGLLKFSSEYTEKMIKLGERDMRAALHMAVKDGKMSKPGTRIPNGKSYTIIDLPK